MTDLRFEGLDRAAALVRSGEVSSLALVDACLQQAERFDASHRAFTRMLTDDAHERADALDKDRARGVIRGPLHGVPIAVKDIFDVSGYPNTGGTEHRRNGPVASKSAPSVAALENAGAVVIGLANLHEWAYGGTSDNPHYGTVVNVWGENRIPGGSSGGSAVAVAIGAAYAALGTDTGGSVRIPAAFTGTAALKVTYGRVSTRRVHPLSWTLDSVGPMARTVADLVTPFEVLQATGRGGHSDWRVRSLKGITLGREDYYWNGKQMESEVVHVAGAALEECTDAGMETLSVSIPGLANAAAAQYAILLAEASSTHGGALRENRPKYGTDVQALLAIGDLVPAGDYLAALRYRDTLFQQFQAAFHAVDFLVSPAIPMVAPPIGQQTMSWSDGSSESFLDAVWRHTFPSNLIGIPTLCLPCGLSDAGLPVGLQIIGPPGSERALLDVGTLLEQRLGHFVAPGVQ